MQVWEAKNRVSGNLVATFLSVVGCPRPCIHPAPTPPKSDRLHSSGWNGFFSLGSVVALTTPFFFMTPEARAQLVDIAEETWATMISYGRWTAPLGVRGWRFCLKSRHP